MFIFSDPFGAGGIFVPGSSNFVYRISHMFPEYEWEVTPCRVSLNDLSITQRRNIMSVFQNGTG